MAKPRVPQEVVFGGSEEAHRAVRPRTVHRRAHEPWPRGCAGLRQDAPTGTGSLVTEDGSRCLGDPGSVSGSSGEAAGLRVALAPLLPCMATRVCPRGDRKLPFPTWWSQLLQSRARGVVTGCTQICACVTPLVPPNSRSRPRGPSDVAEGTEMLRDDASCRGDTYQPVSQQGWCLGHIACPAFRRTRVQTELR